VINNEGLDLKRAGYFGEPAYMKWSWPKSRQSRDIASGTGLLTEFDESLLLIVDPEQLTSNLMSKLRQITEIDATVVYLVDGMASAQWMIPVGMTTEPDSWAKLSTKGHLVLWFRANRQPLFLAELPDVTRYLAHEIQPFVEQGITMVFPLEAMDRLVGLIFLKLQGETLGSEALIRLQGLLRQAGLAFENALLFKERLLQSERMFRAEQLATMGQFAAGIAHELRNPLTTIRSTVQYLGNEFDPDSQEQALARGVLDEVDRLNDIVENLLTLARPTGSQPQALDVAQEIQTYLHFVEAQAKKQGVHIDVAVEQDLPRLYCDGGELRQLLLNLVVNAMEAMPDGGQLGVRAGHGTSSGTVRLEVEDQGSGIAPEQKALIFEPFYTTKSSGTGLGLAICHTIVQRHHGQIWVEDAPSGGTIVKVTLPTEEES
jgi:signal transduction histidine kinase